jgi:Sulfate permease and related transporters (MFS superfamily)
MGQLAKLDRSEQPASSGSVPANPFSLAAQLSGIQRWLPGLAMVQGYKRAFWPRDLIAGIVLTSILVPAGMGYAQASGLPAVCGIYATIAPLAAYAIFGQNRVLVLGPDSSLCAIIAATIFPLAALHPERAVALAGALAVLSGLLCILAGVIKFGFVTDLLSKPIRYGYLNGIALTLIVGQLPTILGFSGNGTDLIEKSAYLVQGISTRSINWTAFAIGSGCLLLILICKNLSPKIPGILLAVIFATLAASVFDLAATCGVDVIGALPHGFPAFQLPNVSLQEINHLFAGAVAIALVSFADMSVVSRAFATRGGYEVDDNHELIALGAANVAAGCYSGFSVSASASRTPVAVSAGGKTQVTGLVGALGIILLVAVAPTLLRNLPSAALAAIVIAAAISLFEIRAVCRLYKLQRIEFWFSIVSFLGVALIGVIQGVFIAIGLALSAFIWRAWRPHDAVLGRVNGLKGYHDVTRHPDGKRIPGLVMFRWDAPLFFANARIFQEHVLKSVADSPTLVKWVVVAAEPVTDIDITAADMLTELISQLHEANIELRFAEMKGPAKDELKRYGLFSQIGVESFYPTLGQAVDGYLEATKVEWQDWDEV